MRRTKLVLAALAVMVAMLLVFSAPALADKNKNNNGDRNNDDVFLRVNNDNGFDRGDHFKCCDECCDGDDFNGIRHVDDLDIDDEFDDEFELEVDENEIEVEGFLVWPWWWGWWPWWWGW
jgi:hypothetical protein